MNNIKFTDGQHTTAVYEFNGLLTVHRDIRM